MTDFEIHTVLINKWLLFMKNNWNYCCDFNRDTCVNIIIFAPLDRYSRIAIDFGFWKEQRGWWIGRWKVTVFSERLIVFVLEGKSWLQIVIISICNWKLSGCVGNFLAKRAITKRNNTKPKVFEHNSREDHQMRRRMANV